jgi:putative transposase
MQYRRARTKGGTYFFTVVTFERMKILTKSENVAFLGEAFRFVKKRHPFSVDALVLLPDHLHCIWTLPERDNDFSTRWRLIKTYFTRNCDRNDQPGQSLSRLRKNEQAVWQRRFWEHCIRDEEDFRRHVEYIHYNPVKHGLAPAPTEWKYSSFHRYVREGRYHQGWGQGRSFPLDWEAKYE